MPLAAAAAAVAALTASVAVWSLTRPEPQSLERFVITTPPDGLLVQSGLQPDVAISGPEELDRHCDAIEAFTASLRAC